MGIFGVIGVIKDIGKDLLSWLFEDWIVFLYTLLIIVIGDTVLFVFEGEGLSCGIVLAD